MQHLRLSMYGSPPKHPQQLMRKLGIKYLYAVPQSIADQWWFLCCENVPRTLPAYITPLGFDPAEAVGHGVTPEMAEEIRRRSV